MNRLALPIAVSILLGSQAAAAFGSACEVYKLMTPEWFAKPATACAGARRMQRQITC